MTTTTHPSGPAAQPRRPPRGRFRLAVRALRRAVLARRRLGAALLAGIAVLAGLRAATAPAETTAIWVAGRDLPAGAAIAPADLVRVSLPPEAVPAGLVENAVGRTLASPLRKGEAVTDVRAVGPALVDGYPGLVAVPVRLPDAEAAALLRVGDGVDLLAADPRRGDARSLGEATVLAIPKSNLQQDLRSTPPGTLVLVGVSPGAAEEISAAAVQEILSFTFSG